LDFNSKLNVLHYCRLPKEHRKLLTVEYGGRKDGVDVIMEDTLSLFRSHLYDESSYPYKSESIYKA
jgi:hypothetical protein